MSNLPDQQQRLDALNPTESFIIQAPAGSGKTELLTQRYLKLLSTVDQPENILAITFTNKAANEMQDRIIRALHFAHTQPKPESAHAAQTYDIAKLALARDQAQQWHLLDNPSRLGISTIDAFCYRLTQRLPIQSKFGAKVTLSDDPRKLYLEATKRVFALIDDDNAWAEDISKITLHLDNNYHRLEYLIVSMLAKRDQWLGLIGKHIQRDDLREYLESELIHVNESILTELSSVLSAEAQSELFSLAQYAACQLLENETLGELLSFQHTPPLTYKNKHLWLAIFKLFLTTKHTWRKTVTVKQGFPAPSAAETKEEKALYAEWKDRYKQFLLCVCDDSELINSIQNFILSPSLHYNEDQWDILSALLNILPLAAAQLKLIFCEYSSIDYVENSLAALQALGSDEAPTDLALILDHTLQHILVDEFQDTSINQFMLLTKLSAEWMPNDGRTFFLVGDPMQSIYRFREAEVGLFLKAKQSGIGKIPLTNLVLRSNFRSESGIVDWVNDTFVSAFPAQEDISTGKVCYSNSNAIHPTLANQNIHHHFSVDDPFRIKEALLITESIAQAKNDKPNASMAILVKSRSHLLKILPQLKEHGITYQAVEIEYLSHQQHILDLVSLTKALLHLGDRTSWLAILRAPWCGLTLKDLTLISNTEQNNTIWKNLQDPNIFATLSQDGQQRIEFIAPRLKTALNTRSRTQLRDWIEETWLALHAELTLPTHTQSDANDFFELLGTLENGVDPFNFETFDSKINLLFAECSSTDGNPVQVMTIHKSKGLEFDIVILPGLDKRTVSNDKQLLRWLEFPDESSLNHLLIAPIHQQNQDESIYKYIETKDKEKFQLELTRLFYVAVTRAKSALHLFSCLEETEAGIEPPHKSSLLAIIWPFVKEYYIQPTEPNLQNKRTEHEHGLKRFTNDFMVTHAATTTEVCTAGDNTPDLALMDPNNSASTGTIIHKLIEITTQKGSSWWMQLTREERQLVTQNIIKQLSLPPAHPENINKCIASLDNMCQDKQGLWLLQQHDEDQCEYAITNFSNDKFNHLVIDRTFVENGVRWIIDYKTSLPDNESIDEFIQTQTKLYKEQLNAYKNALSGMSSQEIKLALYFTSINYLHEIAKPPTTFCS